MSGKEITLDLKEYVRVREGRQPRHHRGGQSPGAGRRSQNVIAGDGNALRYAAQPDYVGPGSVTFEVTDGIRSGRSEGPEIHA